MVNSSQGKDPDFKEYLGNEMKATSQYPFFIFFPGVRSLQEFHSLKVAMFSALLSETTQ